MIAVCLSIAESVFAVADICASNSLWELSTTDFDI